MPAARDDDEDEAPPLRPAKPAAPRPAGGPRPPDPGFAWGVCGVLHHAGSLDEFPGQQGVTRYTIGGVHYAHPPVGRGWRPATAEPDRYEMVWDGDPAAAGFLSGLRQRLEAAVGTGVLDDPDHPLLGELDTAAASLTTLAGRLHREGWSVGLLRPDNVIAAAGDVVLVDLGFTWQGAFGAPPWDDSPGRPGWLDPAAPFAWLYQTPPVRQQFASPDNGVYPPTPPADDVRAIGRLLAWLVSGQPWVDLPPIRHAAPVWAVLADAVGGKVASADELAARLRASPPSGHFITHAVELPDPAGPVPESGAGRKWWFLLAVLVVVAGAGLWLATRDSRLPSPAPAGGPDTGTQVRPSPAPPEPAADAGLRRKLAEYDETPEDDLSKRLGLIRETYDPRFDGEPAELKTERAARRAEVVDDWIAAYRETVETAADPGRRLAAADRFKTLQAELESLTSGSPATDPPQASKEKQCLAFVSARVRELVGSPP